MNLHTHKHPTSLMNNLHKRGHFGDILFQLIHLEWWTTLFNHKRYTTKYLNLRNFFFFFFFFWKLQNSPWFCKITERSLNFIITNRPLSLYNYRKAPQVSVNINWPLYFVKITQWPKIITKQSPQVFQISNFNTRA